MIRLIRLALPPVAAVLFVAATAAIVWSAGSTLGYDFHAYEGAARRVLGGERLYDPAVDVAGGFAIYLYPPPFAIAVIPFALLGGSAAVWLWTATLIGAFLAGVALLPVSLTVRWLVLLLAALDWPVLYSVKLGQVGPLLFLLFAIGWRAMNEPRLLGGSIALGALVKVQPAILVGWAIVSGRWRAAAVAIGVIALTSLATLIVAGSGPWLDYPALLARVSAPLTTPHNFTPGAIAFQAGASIPVAAGIQLATTSLAVLATLFAARTLPAVSSYLIAVVASQLISPLLWDHYAIILLIPVAWLLDQRQWWAVAIPLSMSILVIGLLPPAVYPIAFGICLIAPMVVGSRKPVTLGSTVRSNAR